MEENSRIGKNLEDVIKRLSRKEVIELIEYLEQRLRIGASHEKKGTLNISDFSFNESQKMCKDIQGSMSEIIVEERRQYL